MTHYDMDAWPTIDDALAQGGQRPRRGKRIMIAGTAAVTGLALAGWGLADAITAGDTSLPSSHDLVTTSHLTTAQVAAQVEKSVVDIVADDGYTGNEDAGTGMVLTRNGEVLTNNHVVEGATRLTVTMVSTGRIYSAKVIGTDATHDVAVIKLKNAHGLTPITVGDSSKVTKGISVIAIGNAGGRGTPTVTTGKITAIGKTITASDEGGSNSERLHDLFKTDADIISGDSGGPMVDASGQVIAMDTAAAESTNPNQGFFSMPSANITSSSAGYSIPIKRAIAVATEIVDGESSNDVVIGTPGFLGIEVQSAPANGGAEVVDVINGGPAAKAGLAQGDVITDLNGTRVATPTQLTKLLQHTHGGQTVKVTWTDTQGTSHTSSVKLIAGPAA